MQISRTANIKLQMLVAKGKCIVMPGQNIQQWNTVYCNTFSEQYEI